MPTKGRVTLSKSIYNRSIKQRRASRPTLIAIQNAEQVSTYVRDMHALPTESLRCLYLDTHYQVLHDQLISIGTKDAILAHPREVFKPAIEHGASAIIVVHNHPSGVVIASAADLAATRQLISAGCIIGIQVLDHVIVGKGNFQSIPANYDEYTQNNSRFVVAISDYPTHPNPAFS